MATTPNRGYALPTSGDPADVPADLETALGQVDADVQTLTDSAVSKAWVEDQIEGFEVLPDGFVPIFTTLAEAQAWELQNPGRVALTIEDQSPDTTPPVAGGLNVLVGDTYADLDAFSATDDRPGLQYSFRVDGGAWSAWQLEQTYRISGLVALTEYTFQHRVQDTAHVVEGVPFAATTLATPPVPYQQAALALAPRLFYTGDGTENLGTQALSPMSSDGVTDGGGPLGGYSASYRLAPGQAFEFGAWDLGFTQWAAACLIRFNDVSGTATDALGKLGIGTSGWDVKISNYNAPGYRLMVSNLDGSPIQGLPATFGPHLVGVDSDGTTLTLYVDGVQIGTHPDPGFPTSSRQGFKVSGAGTIDFRGLLITDAPLGATGHADLADAAGLG